MDRKELEKQKAKEVRDRSKHILRLTSTASDSSLDSQNTELFLPSAVVAPPIRDVVFATTIGTASTESRSQTTLSEEKTHSVNRSCVIRDSVDPVSIDLENMTQPDATKKDGLKVSAFMSLKSKVFRNENPWLSLLWKYLATGIVVLFLSALVTVLVIYADLKGSNKNSSFLESQSSTNPSSPLNKLPPSNDPLMEILWEHTILLEDETAMGLWQPPTDPHFLQGVSPQYQAYMWLERRYDSGLPATQLLLEEYALATLYFSTNGSGWTDKKGWLGNESICSWQVRETACNDQGRFVSLTLDNNRLLGAIPPEIAFLQDLQLLSLSENHLTGTLPSSLSWLTNLESMNMSFNHLVSTLPPSLGDLTSLKEFNIAHNKFSGTFPSLDYLSWSFIQDIHLEFNRMEGSISKEFCKILKSQFQTVAVSFDFWADCSVVGCDCCTCCPLEWDSCTSTGNDGLP